VATAVLMRIGFGLADASYLVRAHCEGTEPPSSQLAMLCAFDGILATKRAAHAAGSDRPSGPVGGSGNRSADGPTHGARPPTPCHRPPIRRTGRRRPVPIASRCSRRSTSNRWLASTHWRCGSNPRDAGSWPCWASSPSASPRCWPRPSWPHRSPSGPRLRTSSSIGRST
jgi:hypothetical protein